MESATESRLHRSRSTVCVVSNRAYRVNLNGVQVKRCGKSAPVHKVTYGAR